VTTRNWVSAVERGGPCFGGEAQEEKCPHSQVGKRGKEAENLEKKGTSMSEQNERLSFSELGEIGSTKKEKFRKGGKPARRQTGGTGNAVHVRGNSVTSLLRKKKKGGGGNVYKQKHPGKGTECLGRAELLPHTWRERKEERSLHHQREGKRGVFCREKERNSTGNMGGRLDFIEKKEGHDFERDKKRSQDFFGERKGEKRKEKRSALEKRAYVKKKNIAGSAEMEGRGQHRLGRPTEKKRAQEKKAPPVTRKRGEKNGQPVP